MIFIKQKSIRSRYTHHNVIKHPHPVTNKKWTTCDNPIAAMFWILGNRWVSGFFYRTLREHHQCRIWSNENMHHHNDFLLRQLKYFRRIKLIWIFTMDLCMNVNVVFGIATCTYFYSLNAQREIITGVEMQYYWSQVFVFVLIN